MTRGLWSVAALGAGAALTTLGVQELSRTFVVNLESPHPVVGEVTISDPIPHSRLLRMTDIVAAPATREEPGLWSEVGVVDTAGFSTAVLSLHGQLRGSTSGGGAVVLVLVPEEENVLRALAEGEPHLTLDASAEPLPGDTLYFSGASERLALGFPAYRVFVYNTTERSASVDVYVYLAQ